ncbi:MAG TPA: hybrid sensor histidine kinase/response regulator, partial [Firmicutes bacterium]|nr:hybrid sensor histidine kinase/response regulator [Bacillota bacterium]
TQSWSVTPKIKQLLKINDTNENKLNSIEGSFFENEFLNEIVEQFITLSDEKMSREILIRHKHEPWETLLLKCDKISKDAK